MTEVVQQAMTEQDARRLTERIRLTALTYTEAKAKLLDLVQEAKECGAHEVLGYSSWQAYLSDVLGEEPMRLARDERQEMVKVLSSEGMSTRAIAPIVGASVGQVHADRQVFSSEQSEEPRISHGMDGKTRTHQPKPHTPEQKTSRDVEIINDIRLYLGHIGSAQEIASLSPKGKQHIIDALEDTINKLRSQS